MFFYEAYGAGIHSEFPLPELVAQTGATADIAIREGTVGHRLADIAWDADSSEVTYYRSGVGSCRVRGGHEIVVDVLGGADLIRVRHMIVQLGLGLAMHQSGRLVLHASAVSAGQRAVLFIAPSCGGKSTTAAAFHSWGYGVVADDVVVLDVHKDGAPLVLRALRQLKICPRAAAYLGYNDRDLSPITPYDERFAYLDNSGLRREPLPVSAIYLLAEGNEEKIEQLRPQEAFQELLRYTLPIVTEVLQATGSASGHFRRCASVSQRVPIRRLTRRMSLESLDVVKHLIEEDLSDSARSL